MTASATVTTAPIVATDAPTTVPVTTAPIVATDAPTTVPVTTLPARLTLTGLPGRLAVTARTCGPTPVAVPNQSGMVVCTLNPDGSDTRQVSPPGVDAYGGVWSRDGKSLIYEDPSTGTQILDLATGKVRLRHGGDPVGYWVSPNGKWKLYDEDGISLGRPDSRDRAVIIPDLRAPQGLSMSWSADSKHFVYLSSNDGKGGELPCNEVWIGSVDGTHPVQITHTSSSATSPAACPYDVSWSPDGKKLLLNAAPANSSVSDVFSMNPDGSGFAALTHFSTSAPPSKQPIETGAFADAWSPDSKEIAVEMQYSTGGALFIMRADGTGFTKVDRAPAGLVSGITGIAWARG
jgi:TolB protein